MGPKMRLCGAEWLTRVAKWAKMEIPQIKGRVVSVYGKTRKENVGAKTMFIGKFTNSIDSKSRLIIPSKFRDELGCRCVVAQSLDKCLTISTIEEWEKFLLKLDELPNSNPEARMIKRFFNQSAAVCDVDKQGRVTIPNELKEYAGINKELITIGNSHNIEVWSQEFWDTHAFAEAGEDMTASKINASEIAEKLEKFNF